MSAQTTSAARAVRVLVAEAAEPPVPLSGILEAGGLRVVGRAATPAELERLLRLTQPEVVVFDGEMTAETVGTTRSLHPTIGIVVVWPEGAVAGLAHEHVSPAMVRRDLVAAARRAAPLVAAGAMTGAGHAMQTQAPVGDVDRRRGGVELLIAAVLTFLLVLSSVIFRITEGGGGTFARGRVGSPLPAPSGSASGGSAPLPESPSNSSTGAGVITVLNARIAPPVPPDGSGSGFGSGSGQPSTGGGGGGTTGGGGGGNGSDSGGGTGGGSGGGGSGSGSGGGGTGDGILARRAAACEAAAGTDIVAPPLDQAVAHVLANCLTSTKAPGLLNALTHLTENAQRQADHVPGKASSGRPSPAPGSRTTHDAAGVHDPSRSHASDHAHDPSGAQGNPHEDAGDTHGSDGAHRHPSPGGPNH